MTYVKMVSLNVNSDRRVESGPLQKAFPELSVASRFPLLESFFELSIKNNTNCFTLMEIDNNMLSKLETFFASRGWAFEKKQYTTDPGAFWYLAAYNPEEIIISDVEQCYYTESGAPTDARERITLSKEQKFAKHMDVEFEKSAMIFNLANKRRDNEMYCIAVTQPGLTNKHRFAAMTRLTQFLESRKDRFPVVKTIITGDLNQFDARVAEPKVYEEQVNILRESGYEWASEDLLETGIKSTFIAYPHDLVRFLDSAEFELLKELEQADSAALRSFWLEKFKKYPVITTTLDGVFTKGFSLSQDSTETLKIKSSTLIGNSLFKTGGRGKHPSLSVEELNEKLFSAYKETLAPEMAAAMDEQSSSLGIPMSDHTAITIKF